MKYIIFDDVKILLFPDFVTHADVAVDIGVRRVSSAGFVDIERRECYGESTSLGLKSKRRDSAVLKATLDNCACSKAPVALARSVAG